MRYVRFIATYLELSLVLSKRATPLGALAEHYRRSLLQPDHPYLGD